MQLSENFWLAEFLRSQEAARRGRVIVPTQAQIDNLRRLCVLVLQPLRHDIGRSIIVSSGLRPDWLNMLIGGSPKSAHRFGRAADIEVAGMSPLAVCVRIQALRLPVDQVIHEFPPHGWCHVGIAEDGLAPRYQMLTARHVSGQTAYEIGLHA